MVSKEENPLAKDNVLGRDKFYLQTGGSTMPTWLFFFYMAILAIPMAVIGLSGHLIWSCVRNGPPEALDSLIFTLIVAGTTAFYYSVFTPLLKLRVPAIKVVFAAFWIAVCVWLGVNAPQYVPRTDMRGHDSGNTTSASTFLSSVSSTATTPFTTRDTSTSSTSTSLQSVLTPYLGPTYSFSLVPIITFSPIPLIILPTATVNIRTLPSIVPGTSSVNSLPTPPSVAAVKVTALPTPRVKLHAKRIDIPIPDVPVPPRVGGGLRGSGDDGGEGGLTSGQRSQARGAGSKAGRLLSALRQDEGEIISIIVLAGIEVILLLVIEWTHSKSKQMEAIRAFWGKVRRKKPQASETGSSPAVVTEKDAHVQPAYQFA